jgi:hypothetical protein
VCNPNYKLGPSVCVHVKILCNYVGVNGRLYAHMFIYPCLNHKVLSLSSMDLPNVPFLRNLIPFFTSVHCVLRITLYVLLHRLSIKLLTAIKSNWNEEINLQ